jgi:hypothetical protein
VRPSDKYPEWKVKNNRKLVEIEKKKIDNKNNSVALKCHKKPKQQY